MSDPARFLDDLQKHDPATWEQFYNSHLLPLRSKLARSFDSLSPEEVDDVWAIVIERVYQRIGMVKVPKALGSWLWKVARSQALTYLDSKRRRRQTPIIEEILFDEQQTEGLRDDAVSPRLREAFEAMPPVHRSLLMMRAEGMPNEVIYYFTGLVPTQQCAVLGYLRSGIRLTNQEAKLAKETVIS